MKKSGKPRTSGIWKYFIDIDKTFNKNPKRTLVKCQICNKVLARRNSYGNLYQHLQFHRITVHKNKGNGRRDLITSNEEPVIIFHSDEEDDADLTSLDNSCEPSPLLMPLNTSHSINSNSIQNGIQSDCNTLLHSCSTDASYLKSRAIHDKTDALFIKSVAKEVDNMPEDSVDFIKAAIWKIIFNVKSAKRKNGELTENDLTKSNL